MLEALLDDDSAATGSVELREDTLVLQGEIDTDLCLAFRAAGHDLGRVGSVDAHRVTFLGSPGLSLLAEVARVRGVSVPLRASPAALRTLRMTGVDQLFDVHPSG